MCSILLSGEDHRTLTGQMNYLLGLSPYPETAIT
jgi:hypothetical protein